MILAVESGQRESQESWGAVLRKLWTGDLNPWRCTVAYGHLGIWVALDEQQLTALPCAETPTECERLRDQFSRRYRTLAPKAVERLHAN